MRCVGMSKPKLYVMCGLSGSGKSTIAKQITNDNPDTVIISTDMIREQLTGEIGDQSQNDEVFEIFHTLIRKRLENKYNVIADATNITMKSRRAILNKVNGLDIEKICYIIPKTFEWCQQDNKNRTHPVPDEVLEKQIRRFEIPFIEEGWSKIIIHDEFKNHVRNLVNEIAYMGDFDQKNPHHTMDLYKHCLNTKKLMKEKGYENPWLGGAMMHDLGKLSTQTFDDLGIAHYFDHHAYGSYFVLSRIPQNLEVLDVCFLINYHMLPFSWESEKTKQRWRKRFGEYKYKILMDFHECDIQR